MLSLHTNAASLSTQNSIVSTQKALAKSLTALGTGFRINSAKDDAAGLQIATRLDAQTRGMAVASRNTQNGISLLQTAEGALNEVSNMLLRMKDLATQSADGAASQKDRDAMQQEYDALGAELKNVMSNTTFGGEKLLLGGKLAAAVDFQIGATSAEKMTVDASANLTSVDTALTGISAHYGTPMGAGTEISTSASANTKIDQLATALDSVGTLRATLGASANRLDHVFNNLQNISTNTAEAKGRIMDVDYATESAKMTTKQMLMQASTSMLKQSGSMSQLTMSLLQ